jgi:uncharacterized protein YxjI
MDSILKQVAKQANKIDPMIVKNLDKAGIKIPGVGTKSDSPAQGDSPDVAASLPKANASDFTHFAPIAPQYATDQFTELNLKEKTLSFTGDDAKIKDCDGNVVFKVKADLISFSMSRTMYDAQGRTVAQLRKKVAMFGTTFYIGTPDNEKKVSMKRKNKYNPMNSNAAITIDGQEVGQIKGNWLAKEFSITIDGVKVATIDRKRTIESTVMGADSYIIHITPQQGRPVDTAFIALVTIALDELYNDK